jgi:hypothetical protein
MAYEYKTAKKLKRLPGTKEKHIPKWYGVCTQNELELCIFLIIKRSKIMPENPGCIHAKCTFNRTRSQLRYKAESPAIAGFAIERKGR